MTMLGRFGKARKPADDGGTPAQVPELDATERIEGIEPVEPVEPVEPSHATEPIKGTEEIEPVEVTGAVAGEEAGTSDGADGQDAVAEHDTDDAAARIVRAKAELARAEAELAKARLAEAEAELARAEKAARVREKVKARAAVRPATAQTKIKSSATDADGAEAAAEPGRRRWSRRRGITLVGGLTVLVIVLGAAVAVMWWKKTELDAREQGGTQALTVATAAAQDFSSYDYRSLDSNFKTAADEATGEWLKQYQQLTRQIRQTATQQQIVVVGTVVKAGLEQVSTDHVVALVFVNQQTSKLNQDRGTDQYRLRLTLDRKGGQWLVSKLEAL